MMYLSHLLIDVGTNPDRPRPGRLWLRNRYHVHQRLCMAFPSYKRKEEDPSMLKPYCPDDFGQGHVHVQRGTDTGFLFRIDPLPGNRVIILILSAIKPDWDYAFHNAQYLLAAPPPEPRPFQLKFEDGSAFRFRLVVNPVKRLCRKSKHADGDQVGEKWIGKRVPVPVDDLENWLIRHSENGGFKIRQASVLTAGYAYVNRSGEKRQGQQLRSVRFEGILEVTDPEKFRQSLNSGIGPAKAFGFGLLSIAPI